jgi:hypothetical protein
VLQPVRSIGSGRRAGCFFAKVLDAQPYDRWYFKER